MSTAISRWMMAAATILLIAAACGGSGPAAQYEAHDIEEQRLYVADSRNGQIRLFDTRNGLVPIKLAVLPDRRTVQALRLDARGDRLWVLGAEAVYGYDPRALTLLETRRLPTNTGASRALDLDPDGAPVLVSAGRRFRVVA